MSSIIKSFLVLVFTVKTMGSLFAQEKELPVFKQVTHPFMPPITSEYFFFSEDGLMWFSTASGLTSFDGSELVYYSKPRQTNELSLYGINFMAEDKAHNFYITTGKRLIYYNRRNKTFTAIGYRFKNGNKMEEIVTSSLFIDSDKKVYVGSVTQGLFIYNPLNGQMDHCNLVSSRPDDWKDRRLNTVASFAMHATDTTKLWIGSFHGIYLFDKRSKTFSQNFEITTPLFHKYLHRSPTEIVKQDVTVEKMDVANDSTIWFNSWAGGFGHYNTLTGKVRLFFRDAIEKSKDKYYGYIIPRFGKWKDGTYLLGIFDPHPAVYDPSSGRLDFVKLSAEENIIDEVRFVTNDRFGNVWIYSKGLIYASLPDHQHIRNIPAKGQMRGVYFDKETKLYYTSPWGVYVYDSNFVEKRRIAVPLLNNYYTNNKPAYLKITKDGSGRFWATAEETYILLPKATKFDYVEKIFPSLAWIKGKGNLHDVISNKNGDILLAGNDAVYIVNHKTLVTDTLFIPRSANKTILDFKTGILQYDSVRNKLYAANSNGILQYDFETKTKRLIPENQILSSVNVNPKEIDFALDHEGRVWLWIPAYGIKIIEPNQLICVDSILIGSRGFTRGDFNRMRYGGKDCMLFQSRSGVIIYDYKKQQSIILDKSNGLSSPVTRYMSYCNNYLMMGQLYRIEYFNLDNLSKISLSLQPGLNTVITDSTLVYIKQQRESSDAIRLKYYQNNIQLSFSATEFFFPERIEYAYQLAGADHDWKFAHSFARTVNYKKLKPGKYIFKLKAQIAGGNWQEEIVEYPIIITPAFWQTAWFKLLFTLVTVMSIVLLIRKRIRDIKKKEQLRSRHEKDLLELEAKALRAQMNPHFIFNSLNSIKSLINKNENEIAADYLTTFSKLIRTLFQNSDRREISLYEEIETCKLYTTIEKMRFGNKVEFLFNIDPTIDLKDVKVPALILQPFIENAIWHGLVPKEDGGKITISVKQTNDGIVCMIDDNGIGRKLSKIYKVQYPTSHESKGMGLTQSRLELDKLLNDREDSIRIIDKIETDGVSAGTTIILTFKENIL